VALAMTQSLREGNQMDQNNNNFMDSRTLWAILLVGVVWFGWQQYINRKYPNQTETAAVQIATQAGGTSPVKATVSESVGTNIEEKASERPEELFAFGNSKFNTQISTKGMSLKYVKLASYKDKVGELVRFSGGESGLFATQISGKEIDFQVSKEGPNSFLGLAEVSGVKVRKRISFTEDYKINIETKLESASASIPNIEISIEDELKKLETGSVFSPPSDTQEVFVLNPEGEKEFSLAKEKEGITDQVKQAVLASINGHYFSAAFIDKSEIMPNFLIDQKPTSPFLKGKLQYSFGNEKKEVTLNGVGFVGPKDISVLESADPLLLKMVKFGIFSAIAKPLLITMKWFYGIVGNWGWSIILLTLLVRMIVMPLHIMSFKSMKAMQKVQPLIQSLRDRYKDDQMTLNREMMALMKKHKVNPMGGCLPMLLQIPVFFALYRVFSESIELYQAPFIFWISDLSLKDPFFVLPILMAAVMYLQQKMTPSTMDPAQAKVMQFMPLIFSFMMISLPSALTLYMFVSTFFGILQQYLFLKDKQPAVAIK
jgi:YidC/Oxa1 family membrane protein insertase